MNHYSLLEKRLSDFYDDIKECERILHAVLNHPTDLKRDPGLLDEEKKRRETLMRIYGELSKDIHGMAGGDSYIQVGRTFNAFVSALDPRLDKDNPVKWTGMEYSFLFLNKAIGSCRNAKSKPEVLKNEDIFINLSRIAELKRLSVSAFDLTKLIRLLEELNISFKNRCYYCVIYLVRALIDHVPPIFGYKTFKEVANNYGGQSIKALMAKLDESSRKIADQHLHATIAKSEALPNETQINFSKEIDCLLAEIYKKLK